MTPQFPDTPREFLATYRETHGFDCSFGSPPEKLKIPPRMVTTVSAKLLPKRLAALKPLSTAAPVSLIELAHLAGSLRAESGARPQGCSSVASDCEAVWNDYSSMLLVLFLAALWAGTQNALAGGGSFVTFPALLLSGMDARAANITSTVALFPGQITTGLAGRRYVAGAEPLSFRALAAISLAGGVVGANLLLLTPASFFAHLVPWLVLFATAVFAWGSFGRRPAKPGTRSARHLGAVPAGIAQFLIAIYGGYFGGGIGFLMMAALTMAGQALRTAGATKNALAGIMNAAAVVVFLFSPAVHWVKALAVAAGAIAGGYAGAWLLLRVNDRLLRVVVVLIGAGLTIGMFIRAP